MKSFVYSILTHILEHGSDLCLGGCTLTGLEETHIQTSNSYNLYQFVYCIQTGIRHFFYIISILNLHSEQL
jgi:hypothetical protein